MAVAPISIKVKLLVQVADNTPQEIGTIEVPVNFQPKDDRVHREV